MTISLRDQLAINQEVIQLGDQIKDKPKHFFYSLSAEQLDLCKRVINYLKPSELLSTELTTQHISVLKAMNHLVSNHSNVALNKKAADIYKYFTSKKTRLCAIPRV